MVKKIILLLVLPNFFVIKGNDLFLPKPDPKLKYIPPYTSNLLAAQRKKEEEKDLKDIGNVVKNIVKSSDKELEKKADELIGDKYKLNNFLCTISNHKDKKIIGTQQKISAEARSILDSYYDDPVFVEKTVSLRLKNIDIKEIVELIGKILNLDFIVDSEIKGEISTLNLQDVPASFALKLIFSSVKPQLALVKNFNVWRVVRLEDAILMFESQIREDELKDIVSDFFLIRHTKFSEGLKLRIEKLWEGIINGKTDKHNYYLVFDDNSRKIFFKGRKKDIQVFKTFLKEIDEKISQIRIETRIIIANKYFEESLGLQVSGVYNRSASVSRSGWNYIGYGPITTGGKGDIPPDDLMDWSLNLLPRTASQFLNLPIIFGGRNLNNKRLNLVLNAAESKNEIKTILKPSLLVNSEEPAEILVGEQVPIETSVQERIEGSLRDINTINYKDLGMKLKVKPIVSPDKESVFLDIYVEHSYVKDGTSTTSFDAKKSIIVTTKSSNRVLLKSGETTLIGGLIYDDKRNNRNGIPLLQDIPLLGYLFKGKKKTKSDEQLMIFISPTIIK
ncbi:hypothetical protein GF322_03585 [Candidatus Dependentiae bacterium]|nr:hypothetical protein [Candidatus Dependentiae bacterium]